MNADSATIYLSANGLPRTAEPVTRGVPFPEGALKRLDFLRCVDAQQATVPLQVRGLEQWADGTWKWVLCDWQATVNDSTTYQLLIGSETNPLTSVADKSATTSHPLFDREPLFELELTDDQGSKLPFEIDPTVTIEEPGPIRLSAKRVGYFRKDGNEFAKITTRTSYFANTSVLRVQLTIQNTKKAIHPGGLWDLGDAGSILFKNLSVHVRLKGNDKPQGTFAQEIGSTEVPLQVPFELYQDSSGGDYWKSTNHISRTRQIPLQFQGYRVRNGGNESFGKRANPRVTVQQGQQQITSSVPEFWQNFPKAIEVQDSDFVIHLFPPQTLEPHEIQGGEQKTHVLYLAFGPDAITTRPLEWSHTPLIARVDPKWIEQTKAIKYLTATSSGEEPYQQLVDSAIAGEDTFTKKREVIDEYGWRHFGDIYGDHEAILHDEVGPKPRISHYNNQYDPIAGFSYQWLRRGDTDWYHMMNQLAYHARDIDLYNTEEDKAAYNHGLFWHTYHYVDADTGTHRSYPKNGRVPPKNYPVPGGGPGSEQNYSHGLLLHYYLTGDHASRESCIGMAQWVIDMDDGRKTVFRWLSTADTGVASASRSPDYQGPGRGSGNSLAGLLDGYRLTQNRKFLDKADQIIRRVIHPTDDIQRIVGMTRNGQQYVDAENRWFYVMFLQSLGKYLDLKFERREFDDSYAFAQASLLHYARWMLKNEYPYLSRPEILEYPTETWVAQDMRKCEVFQFAALHSFGEERNVFDAKAEEYYLYVTETLATMPTKTLCRPVVLLLSYGWSRFWHRRHPEDQRLAPTKLNTDFPPKPVFVPQKVIAKKRAKLIVAAGGLFGLVAFVGLVAFLITR